ncbi:PLD nuclease N-terminal domain-containing protein [Algoriphagus sp. PAP.12]|uniref:PLD nuclease N-terminal domain-containing protein n=1 Tax=Algoriphagus sp. PAP.12 TaxID=2996678 RepID=UPI003FA3D00A
MDFFVLETNLWIWQGLSFIVGLSLFGFWAYALIDVIQSEFRFPHEKLTWILFILLLPPFGTFLYLAKSRTSKKRRKFEPNFSSNRN